MEFKERLDTLGYKEMLSKITFFKAYIENLSLDMEARVQFGR